MTPNDFMPRDAVDYEVFESGVGIIEDDVMRWGGGSELGDDVGG